MSPPSSPRFPRWLVPVAMFALPAACHPTVPASLLPGTGQDAGPPPGASSPPSALASGSAPASAGSALVSAGSASAPDPPVREATVGWVVSPADHARSASLVATTDGGVVATGLRESTRKADRGFVARLGAEGETRWRHLGLDTFRRGVQATPDSLYLLAEFSGRLQLAGLTLDATDDASDMALARVSMDGEVRWGRLFNTTSFDRAMDLTALPDGSVVASHGAFASPAKGLMAFTLAGGQDALLSRWDPDGSLRWVRSLGWPGYDEAGHVTTTTDGALLAVGTRWKSPSTVQRDLDDRPSQGWIARLGLDGEIAWVKGLGEPGDRTMAFFLERAPGGGAVVAGLFRGKTRLGGVTLDDRRGTSFVAALDAAGDVQWAQSLPPIRCLAVSPSGQVYAVTDEDVLRVNPSTAPARIFHVEASETMRLESCALSGPGRLFVAGTAPVGGRLQGKPIVDAPTRPLPSWRSVNEFAFVARLDL